MGMYLNPGNSGFTSIRNDLYIDKSGLVGLINETIETPRRLTCVSRPRRFGKSFAAKMLCAYYDKTCDSACLFDDLTIAAEAGTYRQHLNKYDVIYLDLTSIMEEAEESELISFIKRELIRELSLAYPQLKPEGSFLAALLEAVELAGSKFIMIIDEWDAPIRETPENEKKYLRFLRSMFKNSAATDRIFAAVYMTGILPVKKDGSQSAISDFQEFSMLKPRQFADYVGFLENEVQGLCKRYCCDFDQMHFWYDGYTFRGAESVYNPNSVIKAVHNHDFDSYWTETSAAQSLMEYISLDFGGLSGTVAELLGGGSVKVNTAGFANDLITFRGRDDVLTLLIHLGYLAYDTETGTARIPNEEIRLEFARTIREVKRDDTILRVRESDRLIEDTIHRNAKAVAAQIEKIHAEEAPLHYNNEHSLRSVLKRAYFSCGDEYILFEELPSGVGYADLIYLPKKDSLLPALVIELKWNQAAKGAIAQIRNRQYFKAIENYGGEILLVGIAYDKSAPAGERKHTCIIEAYHKEGITRGTDVL